MATVKTKAGFVEPMLLLRMRELGQGPDWLYEIKLDGYRALGIKTNGEVHLRSRNDNDFSTRYSAIAKALAKLPDETVVDGEVVALDAQGKPSFNTLQNYDSSHGPILYYVFDLLMLAGRNVMGETLERRRALLEEKILPRLGEPVRYSPELKANLADLVRSARAQRLEGLVAKRRDSKYEPGIRSGAWQKMRLNQGQKLVIGGYTPTARNFDALIIGYYREGKLIYAARTRNGFTPASREALFRQIRKLETSQCPFANLPEAKSGRWGAGLTAAKMVDCRWLLCRMRHSSHNVECRTMPHRGVAGIVIAAFSVILSRHNQTEQKAP